MKTDSDTTWAVWMKADSDRQVIYDSSVQQYVDDRLSVDEEANLSHHGRCPDCSPNPVHYIGLSTSLRFTCIFHIAMNPRRKTDCNKEI